jgi:hypothetical protein
MEITHKYDDILHLSRPESPNRARMSMVDRGAQFSPFAALVGYDAAIAETARLTDFQIELTEGAKAELNETLRNIAENVRRCPEVHVTWFVPDERKSGGAYVTGHGCVKKVDAYREILVLTDGREIPFGCIYEIEQVCRAENMF